MKASLRSSRFITATLLLSALIVFSPVFRAPTNSRASFPSEGNQLSIILMIGDGMGFEHKRFSRWVEVGKEANLTMEQLQLSYAVATYSADNPITDSAASATAMATGVKTNNGMVAMNPSGQPLETILEIAQTQGKSTGVVTTSFIQHATPASFITHVTSRNNYSEITRQIVEEAEIDVLLGGGKKYFSTEQLNAMQMNGYTIVENKTALASVTSGKALGLFSEEHIEYERYRDYATTPSLTTMTNKSIEILSQDSDGFFLMVEGGRIDHAGHDNDKVSVALETIAFDEAVKVALDYVQENNNTILMVTADHETGGLEIFSDNLNDILPSDSITEAQNRELRIDRATNITVSWSSTYHTATDVPLYCYGSAFNGLQDDYLVDNIELFHIMNSYFSGTPITIPEYLPPPPSTTLTTTEITTPPPSTTLTTTETTTPPPNTTLTTTETTTSPPNTWTPITTTLTTTSTTTETTTLTPGTTTSIATSTGTTDKNNPWQPISITITVGLAGVVLLVFVVVLVRAKRQL
ncbi:MAG: alkaline phosphatase [Candidatus Heimdallarchaeota archaeon]